MYTNELCTQMKYAHPWTVYTMTYVHKWIVHGVHKWLTYTIQNYVTREGEIPLLILLITEYYCGTT